MTKIKKSLIGLIAFGLSATMIMSMTAISTTAYAEELEESTEVSMTTDLEGVDIDVAVPTEVGVVTDYDVATINDTDYSDYFAGSGTADDPFLIGTVQEFLNIQYLSSDMVTNYYYFRLTNDIDFTKVSLSGSGYLCTYFQGEINGYKTSKTQYSIKSTSNSSLWLSAYTVGKADFLNLDIYENEGGFLGLVAYTGAYITGEKDTDGNYIYDNIINFNNITVDGSYTVSSNAAPLTAITYGTTTFEECTNKATISITGYAGIFLGGYPIYAEVAYIACVNEGTVYGVCVGFFNGNSFNDYSSFKLAESADFDERDNSEYDDYSLAYVEDCENNGEISGTTSCSPFATNIDTSYNADANYDVVRYGYFTEGTMGLSENYLKYFSCSTDGTNVTYVDNTGDATDVDVSKIDTYQLLITVSTTIYSSSTDDDGNTTYTAIGTGYVRLQFDFNKGDEIKAAYITSIVSSDGWTSEEGKTYSDLAGTTGYDIYTDHLGHKYIIDGNTAVVDSESMIELVNAAYDYQVAKVTCSTSSPTYALTGYYGEIVYGTHTITASSIPVITTDTTNE